MSEQAAETLPLPIDKITAELKKRAQIIADYARVRTNIIPSDIREILGASDADLQTAIRRTKLTVARLDTWQATQMAMIDEALELLIGRD